MLAHRRTKIVATIGPATQSSEMLEKCIKAGMNVARLNFSHGKHEDHLQVIQSIRSLSQKLKAPVTLLQDLQGPKIRVGKLKDGKVFLKEGEEIRISVTVKEGDEEVLSTDFKELIQSCQVGTKILLDDGLLELAVTHVGKEEVKARVVYGGVLKERKGMNLPGAILPVECMTEKDYADLEFGLANNVDYIALSFVRRGSDIKKLRELINAKNPQVKIIAKIEMLEALDNLVEIIHLSDAVMVARGDLAIEAGATQLPLLQKRIIALCNEIGRPVITATQMLDSMVANPTPTRAEITDIANAVLDGSDALMLSAESASGAYPIKCIQTMHDIVLEVEKTGSYFYDISLEKENLDTAESISISASLCALKLNAAAIVCLTTTGRTASLISKYRPKAPIVACTYKLEALNRLELVWGLNTFHIQPYKSSDEAMEQIEKMLVQYGFASPGDKVILTLGMPVSQGSKTNSLRVYTIGDVKPAAMKKEDLPFRFRG
jgi:pyruvate kinase